MKRKYYVGNGRYWTKRNFKCNFEGSNALFEYCWRKVKKYSYGDEDIAELLEYFASMEVNNEKSKFYIYG